MSTSITGLNAVLEGIGRSPEIFYRDTSKFMRLLQDLERINKTLENLPMCKKQAE